MEKVKKLIEYFKISDFSSYSLILDEFINNIAPKPAEKGNTNKVEDG